MQVHARNVLCFLGPEGSFDDLTGAIEHEIAEVAPLFGIDREFSIATADERMSDAFGVCWDRVHETAFMREDQQAVARHGAVLYVLSPPMPPDASVAIASVALELVDRVIRRGAIAVKGESAGVAHGVARWAELAREARTARESRDAMALSRACRLAFAKRPLGRGDHFASVGFHLVGLPDVLIPRGTRAEMEVVREIDRTADVMADEGVAAAIAMLDGVLEEDSCYELDSFKFNPFGVVRARRRLN